MYQVIFDDPLIGGDFYKTESADEGIYELMNLGLLEHDTVPQDTDQNQVPTLLSDELSHPVRFRNGANPKGGRLKVSAPLSAAEGQGRQSRTLFDRVFSGQAS